MKSRGLCLISALVVILGAAGCGSKETAEKPAETPATSAPAATPVDAATAGAIAGTVKLEGAAPKGKRIKMDAEPACAAKHAGGVVDEEVVTGDGGALANVVVYVKDGLGNRTFATATETVVMDQNGCMYTPHVVGVQTNQTLEVKNSDPTTHNIHPVPANNKEWNESQAQGMPALKKSFAREELAIPVKCNVHPWMKSYVAVFKHPYFNVTAKTGKFEIKNLPPGDYTIEAWHEKLGVSEQKVTIGAKETKSLSFVFKAPAGD